MENLLKIHLSDIEYHLFNGGWKIHHIMPDAKFKAQPWGGYQITTNNNPDGAFTVHDNTIKIQDIEIIPGGNQDIHYWRIFIDKKLAVEQRRFSTKGQSILSDLMKNEGLTPFEFHNKKFDLHSQELQYFSGKIIHFTEFKYHL